MNVKSRSAILLTILLVFSILLTACNSKTTNNSANKDGKEKKDPIVIKLGTVLADSEAINQYAIKAAEAIKKRTNGQVEIQVYPNSTLGSNKDAYEQILSGAPVIGHGDPGYWADYVPDVGVLNGPYVVTDPKDFTKLTDSEWYQGIHEKLAQKGLTVLSMDWYFGSRHVISKKPIRTPEDLKGMTVRIPPNTMWKETIEAMGGIPTQLEWSEVYTGLESGVVDAAEAPLSTLYGSKLYEVADTVSLTGHFKAISGFVIGTEFFNSLPEDVQKIMLEEFRKYGLEESQVALKSEEEFKQKLKDEGVKFVDVDEGAFQKATEVVYSKFKDWTPGLHDKIKGIIGSK